MEEEKQNIEKKEEQEEVQKAYCLKCAKTVPGYKKSEVIEGVIIAGKKPRLEGKCKDCNTKVSLYVKKLRNQE